MGKESPIAGYTETCGHVCVQVKKPDLRYLNAFIELKCAPELLELRLFPNAKEITESMAMYNAVLQALPRRGEDLGDFRHRVFVIGDGGTPRTAALFAFRTRWTCFSIDPLLKIGERLQRIERLALYPNKIQELQHTFDHYEGAPGYTIVVLPHAHVSLDSVAEVIPKPDFIVAMPCCNPHARNQEAWMKAWGPDHVYADWGVHSPHRMIRVWNFVKGD